MLPDSQNNRPGTTRLIRRVIDHTPADYRPLAQLVRLLTCELPGLDSPAGGGMFTIRQVLLKQWFSSLPAEMQAHVLPALGEAIEAISP